MVADIKLYKFFDVIEKANIVFSLLSNVLLIWVIFKKSKELGSYRHLLLVFAINDIWFAIVHFLTMPIICSYRDAFIMFSAGILTSKFSICLFAATFSQTMPVMAHLFFYRLVVLKWPKAVKFYTGWNTAIFVLITVLMQLCLWFSNCWFNYNSDDELRSYVKPFLDSEFPGQGQGHIGALYYNETGLRPSAVWTTMGFNTIMSFWLTFIFTCSVLIIKIFKTWSGANTQNQHIQKQLFNTLVLQMAIPIVVVYLPCAGIINFPIFFRISVFPNFVSVAATVFPVADAVITLVCVKIFRQPIRELVRKVLLMDAVQNLSLTTTAPTMSRSNASSNVSSVAPSTIF